MFEVSDLVNAERVLLDIKVNSKRELFQDLAEAVERATGIEEGFVLAALIQREKLGTTGIGDGIAVPHARLAELRGIKGFFARLATPVDYDSLDDEPVDLVFLIIAPEAGNAEQLKALARIARLMRDPNVAARLRAEPTPAQVLGILRGQGREATV